VLNSLLAAPGARLGVIINDFGAINVDAALVTGQVDQAEAISGGCLCCMPDNTPLDEALERLARPQLRLDAIVIEASGAAEPLALANLIRFSGVEGIRTGGVIEVVDAGNYFGTVDRGGAAPARFAAASLVLLNKADTVAEQDRQATLQAIRDRIRERNEYTQTLVTDHGAVDPQLVLDVAHTDDPPGQLPIAALAREAHAEHHHQHADAVTVRATGTVDPDALVDLLEDIPADVYRLKGTVSVTGTRGQRRFLVSAVGWRVHVTERPAARVADTTDVTEDGLVAIGMGLDRPSVQERLERALAPAGRPTARGMARLLRWKALSG
jgi:G3E family GTPase